MVQVKGTKLPPKQDYNVLTDNRCKKCGNSLKFNLIRKKPNARLCYKCHKGGKQMDYLIAIVLVCMIITVFIKAMKLFNAEDE